MAEINTENIMTDENGIRHCTQCKNQCPEDALKCRRGRRLFGIETEEGGDHEHGEDRKHEHGHHGGHHRHHDEEKQSEEQ